jgi:hypothetical protein
MNLIENQAEVKVCKFLTDRGGEFNNSIKDDFLVKTGIQRVTTIAHSPKTNRIVERSNLSIMD